MLYINGILSPLIPQTIPAVLAHLDNEASLMSLKPCQVSEVPPSVSRTPPSLPHKQPLQSPHPHPRSASVVQLPEVPNSPRPHTQTVSVPMHTVSKMPNDRQISDGMSLSQLAKRYSKSCPFRMRILKGYCGQTMRLTLSSQDTYNVHLVKHTQVMLIRDAHKTPYSVPLNSAVEFGIIYDRNNQCSETLEVQKFERVSDILALTNPPKVCVCASMLCYACRNNIIVYVPYMYFP